MNAIPIQNPKILYNAKYRDRYNVQLIDRTFAFQVVGSRIAVDAMESVRLVSTGQCIGTKYKSVFVSEEELTDAIDSVTGRDVKIVKANNTLYYLEVRSINDDTNRVMLQIGDIAIDMPKKRYHEITREMHMTRKEYFESRHGKVQ